MWETNHLLLFELSRQWLTDGSVNGMKMGTLRVGYGGDEARTSGVEAP
jgi:hypothetical protein